MTARLHRFQECDKFSKYKGGTMLGPNAPSFNPKRPKMLINKAIEIEHAEKACDKAFREGITDLSHFETMINNLKRQLDEMFASEEEEEEGSNSLSGENASSEKEVGMKAFTCDLRKQFKGLDDVYVWHALCGAWGGVRPGSTNLNSKVIPATVSHGLDGTMEDLAVVKLVQGGIGLVHPDQAGDFYESMHSYLAEVGITGVKVDVIHVSFNPLCVHYNIILSEYVNTYARTNNSSA